MESQEVNFEEMRNQIAILRQKLDRQEIVSDRLLRDTMRVKVSDINKTKKFHYSCCIVCFMLFPYAVYIGVFSWPFALASCLMVLFAMMATHYIHLPIDRVNLMTEDLATVACVMDRFNRQYDFWLHYITPSLILPWLTWACYEFAWKNTPKGINPMWACLPIIAGGVIGLCIGYKYHRKATNAARSIRAQIMQGE